MATETVPMDDRALFESATADAAPEVTTQAEPVVEAVTEPGPLRDEHGRFAPKEAATEQPAPIEPLAPAAVTKEPDTAANVPSWRLREVNDAREAAERRAREYETRYAAMERQLAELQRAAQPKAEPVDFFTDPDAALKQRLSPIEAQFQSLASSLALRASRAEAKSDHGKDAVAEMEQAIGQAMQDGHPDMASLSQRMRNSDHPVEVAMQWFKREKLLKETGGDVNAFRSKTLDDALKDPAFLAKAIEAVKAQASGGSSSPQTQSIVQLPPSINRATSSASPHEDMGDLSDRSLFAYATK